MLMHNDLLLLLLVIPWQRLWKYRLLKPKMLRS